MINSTPEQIKLKRKQAIELLAKVSLEWDDDIFTNGDFALDKLLRNAYRIPMKGLGKEPLDFIKV